MLAVGLNVNAAARWTRAGSASDRSPELFVTNSHRGPGARVPRFPVIVMLVSAHAVTVWVARVADA